MAASILVSQTHARGDDTAYVFCTDGTTPSAAWQSAARAQIDPSLEFTFILPSTSLTQSINGTAISYGGTSDSIAQFNVLGDLNVGSTDRVLAYGSNLLSVGVANNATLASGSIFGSPALGTIAGAGGGTGGTGTATNVVSSTTGTGGAGGGEQNTGVNYGYATIDGENGLNGGNGASPTVVGNGVGFGSYGGTSGSLGEHAMVIVPANPQTNMFAYYSPTAPSNGAASSTSSATLASAGQLTLDRGGVGGMGGQAGSQGQLPGRAASNGYNGQQGYNANDAVYGNNYGGYVPITGANGGVGVGSVAPALTGNVLITTVAPGTATNDNQLLYAGGGGGGGANGSSGMAGAGGGGGGAGGGGGDSAAGIQGGFGGYGADGYTGGTGGVGGAGGNGGAGGGGIRLEVAGALSVNGNVTTAGGVGAAGSAGKAGGGIADYGNVVPETGESGFGYTSGGNGGAAGNGDVGQNGATGGAGGTGSAGDLQLEGAVVNIGATSTLTTNNTSVSSFGGNKAATNDLFSPFASRVNPFSSYTPFPSNAISQDTPGNPGYVNPQNTPNLPQLVGGADTYGILSSTNGNTTTADTATAATLKQQDTAPQDVGVVSIVPVTRFASTGIGAETGNVVLEYTNISGSSINAPTLAANVASDSTQVTPTPLLYRGYANNSFFTPGAAGDQTITALSSSQTWVTLLNGQSARIVTATATLYNSPRTFTATFGVAGGTLPIVDGGLAYVSVAQAGEQGVSAEPDGNQVTGEAPSFYRFGSGPQPVTVRVINEGHANSILTGAGITPDAFNGGPLNTILGSGFSVGSLAAATANPGSSESDFNTTFQGLDGPDGADRQGTYTFNAGNSAGSAVLTLDTYTVVPTLSFPTTVTIDEHLDGSGNSATATLINTAGSIYDQAAGEAAAVHILSVTLTGPDADDFSYLPITNDDLLSLESGELPISYNGSGFVPENAELLIQTDIDATANTDGAVYTINLVGTESVPEPVGLSGLSAAAALLARRRR